MQAGLNDAMNCLGLGGKLVVISFHSLEDRMVKQAMRARAHPPEPPKGVPLRVSELPVAGYKLIGKASRAGDGEVSANPRARSAIMRVIERVAVGVSS